MGIMLNDKEAKFVSELLSMAADRFANHTCNDLPEEMEKVFTQEEWDSMNKKFHKWNGSQDEFEEGTVLRYDWLWMNYFSAFLNGEIE